MPRTLYTPRLSDDVVRALYREGQRRRMPMTRLADDLLRQSLGLCQDQASEFLAIKNKGEQAVPYAPDAA